MHAPTEEYEGNNGTTATASAMPDVLLELEEMLSFVDEVLPSSTLSNAHGDTMQLESMQQMENMSDSTDDATSETYTLNDLIGITDSDSPIQVDESTVNTTSVAPATSTTSKPIKKRDRRHRKRQKHELEYLRSKVDELETELAHLQVTNPTLSETHVLTRTIWATLDGFANEDKKDPAVQVLNMWKQVAAHQKQEAELSAAENEALRELLHAQVQLAKKLEAAYKEYQLQAHEHGVRVDPLPRMPRERAVSYSDTVAFSTLGHELTKMHEQADQVMHECGLAGVMPNDNSSTAQFKSDADGSIFEFSDSLLIPFSLEAVSHAMWRFRTRSHYMMSGAVHEVCHSSDNINYTIVSFEIALPSTDTVSARVRVITQRYTEADREVVVWESIGDFEGLVSFQSRMQGWYVYLPSDDGAHSSPSCIVKFCARVKQVTTPLGAVQDSPPIARAAMNLSVIACHRNLLAFVKLVEYTLQEKIQAEAIDIDLGK